MEIGFFKSIICQNMALKPKRNKLIRKYKLKVLIIESSMVPELMAASFNNTTVNA